MMTRKKNLAAIDVGTNSLHLIVAEVNPSTARFKTLYREKDVVRLGAGSTDIKYLSEAAMGRAVEVLRRFKLVADSLGATVRAVGTSAVREALNQDEFLRRVRLETGITIELASGFEEARLIHLGVLQALPIFRKRHLMVDIGGGSTEFLLGYQRRILYNNSLKIGAVRLTQRFFQRGKVTPKLVKECSKFVRGMLQPVHRAMREQQFEIAAGSSGTILNIANIIRLRRGGDAELALNNEAFTADELDEILQPLLAAGTAEERSRIQGLDPGRADIIVAGGIILHEVFKELGIKRMVVSEYALREGIILDTIEKLHLKKRSEHLQQLPHSSVLHLAENLNYEKQHSHQVARLALSVFDQLVKLHRLGPSERSYLQSAALLHEVGLFVSHAQHHRHSYYLIRNSELLGFTENEKEIIACVARYHRKSHPKLKHEGYNRLSAEDQLVVRKLAAILRIADGFDRTHSSLVSGVRCRHSSRTTLFSIRRAKRSPLELELWGAERKKSLFEEVFRSKARFSLHRR